MGRFDASASWLAPPVERTKTSGGNWTVESFSSEIPAGAVALIGFVSGYSDGANVRMKGSTDDRKTGGLNGCVPFIVGLDASREMEWWAPYNGTKFVALGYLTSGFTGLTNALDVSQTATGSYVDLNALPSGATAAMVEIANTSMDSYYLRAKSAADDYYAQTRHTGTHWFTQVDANRIAQAKISATSVDMFVTGYFGSVAGAPTLTSVDTDNSVTAGQQNVGVVGTGLTNATFQLVQGSITSNLNVDSTSGTTAQIDIAQGNCRYGTVTVRATTVNGTADLPVALTAETGTKYVNLVSVDGTAGERITAVPDLQIGWQLRAYGAVGGLIDDVTLFDDGTFSAPPGMSFQVQVHAGVSWGAAGTQTTPTTGISIVQQPDDVVVTAGQQATFTMSAASLSGGITYQWRKNGVVIASATSTSYTTPTTVYPDDNGALYSCLASNVDGTAATRNAVLTVNAVVVPNPPAITTQPLSQTITEGNTVALSVVANYATSYQWRKNGVSISGAVASTYTTPTLTVADTGSLWDCVITGAGGSVTSAAAVITVNPAAVVPGTTATAMIARIKRQLSRKADTALEVDIFDEMIAAQETLEQEPQKPYFLRKWTTVVINGPHEYIDLLTEIPGFLRMCNYRAVQVLDPLADLEEENLAQVKLIEYNQLIEKDLGTGEEETLPTYAAMIGQRMFLRPRQVVSRTYIIYAYVRDVSLQLNATNLWLEHASNYLMGEAGMAIAQSLRDDAAMKWFAAKREQGKRQVIVMDASLDIEGHDLYMGGED
jgi:hypothetical protein